MVHQVSRVREEMMVPPAALGHQDPLGHLAALVFLELRVKREMLDLTGQLVSLDRQVQLGLMDFQVLQVPPVILEIEVKMEIRDLRVTGVPWVLMDHPGSQDPQDLQETQVKVVFLVGKVIMVEMEGQALLVSQAQLAMQDPQEIEVHLVSQDKRANGVARDCQATQGLLDPRGNRVLQEALASQAL